MSALLKWTVAGALGGAWCGLVEVLARPDVREAFTVMAPAAVGRFATAGAALGLAAALLDVLARSCVGGPRGARAVLVLIVAGAAAGLIATGAHDRDGGLWGAFGFLALAAAGVGYVAALAAPRRRPKSWPVLVVLGCATSSALLVVDPEGLRGTYRSLDLLLLGSGLGVAAAGFRAMLGGAGLAIGVLVAIAAVAAPRSFDAGPDELSTLVTTSARVDVIDRVLVAGRLWPPREIDFSMTDVDPASLLDPPRPRDVVRERFAKACPEQPPLNVLWVTIDALRADVTGIDGETTASLTPRLDTLAKEACAFPDAWSQAPATAGSMESFLVGRYPSRTPMASGLSTGRLAFESPSISERARAAGFDTAFFTGLRRDTLAAPIWDRLIRGFETVSEEKSAASDAQSTVTAATRWLAGRRSRFFAWVHLFDPHAPYVSRDGRVDATPRQRWESEVRYADAALGQLLDALEREGLADRTVVIAHADHGEAFNEHGRYYHGTSYFQTQIHVPLVIRVPGIPPATLRGPVSNIDVAPTLVDLLLLDPVPGHQGHSLVARMLQPELRWPRFALAETLVVDPEIPWGEDRIRAITDGRFKLIEYPDGPARLLYDLKEDPGETRNVASSHASDVRRLLGWMAAIDAALGSEGVPETTAALTVDELQRRLTDPDPQARLAAFLELRRAPARLAPIEDALATYAPDLQHTVLTLIDEFLAADLDGRGRDVPLGDGPSAVRFRLLDRLGRSPRFWDAPMPGIPDDLVDAERHAVQVALAARGDEAALRWVKSMEPAPPKAWAALLPALARAGDPDAERLLRQLDRSQTPPDLVLRVLRGLATSRPESFVAYVVDRWPQPEQQVVSRVMHRVVEIALGIEGRIVEEALLALHGGAQPSDRERVERRLSELDPRWSSERVRAESIRLTRQRFEESSRTPQGLDRIEVVDMEGVGTGPFGRVPGPPMLRLRNNGAQTVSLGRGGLRHIKLSWRNGGSDIAAAHVTLPRGQLAPGAETRVAVLLRYPMRSGTWRLSPVASEVTYVVPEATTLRGPEIARQCLSQLPMRALEASTLFEVPVGHGEFTVFNVPARTEVEVRIRWDLDADVEALLSRASSSPVPLRRSADGTWRGRVRTAADGTLNVRVSGPPRLVHLHEIAVLHQ